MLMIHMAHWSDVVTQNGAKQQDPACKCSMLSEHVGMSRSTLGGLKIWVKKGVARKEKLHRSVQTIYSESLFFRKMELNFGGSKILLELGRNTRQASVPEYCLDSQSVCY